MSSDQAGHRAMWAETTAEPRMPNLDDPGTYVTMTESEFADWSQRHGAHWEKAAGGDDGQ